MTQCITVDEQIGLLKSHGVSFELMSENEAREFLYSRSYFFKIKSYERNYTRVLSDDSYTYTGLDFGHLVELSYLDFALSRICLSLALSTEHFLKVRLNQLIMNDPKPDLSDVLVRRILNGDTSSIRSNPYTEDMWMACDDNPSLWHLWELLPLNEHIHLYSSYYDYKGESAPFAHLLLIVRKLRNAVSHGNCLLADVSRPSEQRRQSEGRKYDKEVTLAALRMCEVSPRRNSGKKKALNEALDRLVVNNFAAALLCHLEFADSHKALSHMVGDLKRFSERIERHRPLFFGDLHVETPRNQLVNSTLSAIQRLIVGYCRQAERKLAKLTPVDYAPGATALAQSDTHADSEGGGDADRSDLGGLDAHPEAIANPKAQLRPGGGGDAGGHDDALRERDAHTHEGAVDVDARDDAGQDGARRGVGLLAGQGHGLGQEGEGDAVQLAAPTASGGIVRVTGHSLGDTGTA